MTGSTVQDMASNGAAPTRQAGGHASPQAPPMTHGQILEAMSGLMLALLVAILSSTIVANALPRVVADLHGSQGEYTWVVTAMLLTSTVSTPIWGKLSDLYSKKLLYQIAITIFTLGSVLAGFAQSMSMLIGLRALQGIGMGGLQALVQVAIAAMVSPRDRGRYTGYIGATFAVATVSGPLVGGLIVDTPWLGWRWCFWVTVPIAVIAFVVLARTLKLPTLRRPVSIDWFGALFLVGGVSLLLVWVSLAGKQFAWWSPETSGYVGGGLLALVIAVIIEAKVREPIVPLGMFRNPTVTLATIGTVSVGTAMFGAAVFLGQYFQIARDFTPTHAGLMTLPMVGGLFVSSTVSGQIISRVTGRIKPFLVLGGVVLVTGMGLLSTVDHQTDLVLIGCYLALMGIGVGCLMQNLVLAVQNSSGSRDMGSVTSVVTFFRTLGGSAGVSVLGAVLATKVSEYIVDGLSRLPGAVGTARGSGSGSLDVAHLPAPVQGVVRAAYGDAIGDIFFISACISVITLIAVLFIREVPLRTSVDTPDDKGPADDGNPAIVADQPPYVGASANGDHSGPHRPAPSAGRLAGSLVDRPDEELFVYGCVQDSTGIAVPGVVLTLTDAGGRQVGRARTGDDGAFRLGVDHGGTYVLIASGGGHQPTAALVMVGDRPVRHDVRMHGAGGISGVVSVGDRAVPGAMVVLTDVRGEVVASSTTAADGRYALGDLVGGAYAMTVSASGFRPVARSVTVTDNQRTTVDVSLEAGSRLTGVVRSASLGVPVAEARVTLLDSSGTVVAAATTETDGTYTFTDVPEGEYTVIAAGYPPVATSLRLDGAEHSHDVELGHSQD